MKKIFALLMSTLMTVSSIAAQGGDTVQDDCARDSDTGSIHVSSSEPIDVDVFFELPAFIDTGLANGSMERVGGVIRYSDDKQIAAWLRQGGQIGQMAESSASLLERIVAKHSTFGLALGRVVPILNIAMGGFGLLEQIIGIRAHEAELERIYDRVSEEFQRNREVELLAALDYAENAFIARCAPFKSEAAAQVTFELTVAHAQLVRDLDDLLAEEVNEANVELATMYQVLAMKVCTLSTRVRLKTVKTKPRFTGCPSASTRIGPTPSNMRANG